MNDYPYVRELLRFEEARIRAPITWLGDTDQAAESCDETRVLLVAPPTRVEPEMTVVALPGGVLRPVPVRMNGTARATPYIVAGTTVACVARNVVHLCVDVSTLASDRPLLTMLWEGVAEALAAAAGHVAAHVAQEQLSAFVETEEHVWREALRRLPGEIDSLEYAVSRLESQMREQCTRLFELRSRHRAMEIALPQAVRQAAHDQIAALRRLVPNVYRSIEVRDGAIVAALGPVVIEHDDVEVEVGHFEVRVDLASGDVSIRNTTNVVNQIHHPHVRGPQDICWGNVRAAVARLSAEREWAALLIATHRFLTSFTEGDSYQPLSAWDPDHFEDDDESQYDQDDDDEGSEDETVECSVCLEQTASDEITHVGPATDAVCLGCYERDVFTCACCRRQFTSRDQARESTQCTGCWAAAHFTCPACQLVKPVGEREASGACGTCMDGGGWRVPSRTATQEGAS